MHLSRPWTFSYDTCTKTISTGFKRLEAIKTHRYLTLRFREICGLDQCFDIHNKGQWSVNVMWSKCKIQKDWCTATVSPTIEHHGGHSRTPANQRFITLIPKEDHMAKSRSFPLKWPTLPILDPVWVSLYKSNNWGLHMFIPDTFHKKISDLVLGNRLKL